MKVYTDWSGDANVNFQKGGMGAPPPTLSAAARTDAETRIMQGVPLAGAQMPASLSAAEDVVYRNGYKEWSGRAAPKLQPRPPEPYRTFSETWSYVDENE